jgi:hypothetical protein
MTMHYNSFRVVRIEERHNTLGSLADKATLG